MAHSQRSSRPSDALLATDGSGTIRRANRAAQDLLGRPRHLLQGRLLSEFVNAECRPAFEEALAGFRGAAPPGKPRVLETRLAPLPDEIAELEVVPEIDGRGEITGLGWAIRRRPRAGTRRTAGRPLPEITDRERILASRMIEMAPLVVLVQDTAGRIVRFNPYLERLTGRSLDDVRGADWFDTFLPVRDRERHRALHSTAASGSEVRGNVSSIVAADGREIEIEWYGRTLTDETGSLMGLVSIGHNISERSRVVAQLRAILDTAADGIIAFDEDGSIELFNRAAEHMFGYRSDEVVGRNIDVLMPYQYSDARDVLLGRADDSGERPAVGHRREVVGLRKDGSMFPMELSIGALEIGTGFQYTGVVRDISEHKRLQVEFLQAQKMEAIGRLATGVAHDFNNLLMGLIGCADIALSQLDAGSPARPLIEELRRSATTGASLTRQLLTFSQRREPSGDLISLDAAVAETREMIARLLSEDVQVQFDLGATNGWVAWDAGEVKQVLMNLAVNARDAMPDGGQFRVRTRFVDVEPDSPPGPLRPGPHVELVVADTGCGIDEHMLAFVFEPFFTTKPPGQGTGLGLSSVYGLVVNAGGHVEVESEPGEGAQFRIALPSVGAPARADPAPSPVAAPAEVGAILVVEDESLVRLAVRHYLETHGYRVFDAACAEQAAAIIEDHGDEIDLLVTDVVLPGGYGPALAAELASRHPDVRVLFISAYPHETLVMSGRLDPDTTSLQKPFSEHTLIAAVRQALDRP